MYTRGTKSYESNLRKRSFKESSSIYEANGPNWVGFMVPSPLSLRKTTQGNRAVKGTVESSRYSALISKVRCSLVSSKSSGTEVTEEFSTPALASEMMPVAGSARLPLPPRPPMTSEGSRLSSTFLRTSLSLARNSSL